MKNNFIKIGLIIVVVLTAFVFYANAASDPISGTKACEVHGPKLNCGTDFKPFLRSDYYRADTTYKVYGHRHGASQIDVRICIIPNGQPVACQEWGCSGAGCGEELGAGEGNANIYLHGDSFSQGASPPTSYQISTWAYVDDAGVKMDWSADAFYSDPVYGCKDPEASNYDAGADIHDPSLCVYDNTVTVICQVTDGSTKLRLGGATCSIAGQSGTTNSNGEKSFIITKGTYTLGVTKSGYISYSGTYNISGSTTLPVTLWPSSGGGSSVSCAPSTQDVKTGQSANFSAGGGTGTFSWSAPGGSPATGRNSSSFTTTYSTAGIKTVTVSRGGKAASCKVNVTSVGTSCSDNATMMSTTLPSLLTLTPGQVYNFNVTLKNSGTSWWYNGGVGDDWTTGYKFLPTSSFRAIKATAPDCTKDTAYGHVCPNLSVGGERTWSFNLTAPTIPSDYPFSMRMNHAPGLIPPYKDSSGAACTGPALVYWENYFGQTLSSTIRVVEAPTVDLKCDGADTCGTVSYGSSKTLSWGITNGAPVDTCTIYNAWTGTRVAPGSEGTGSITSDKTWTIQCTGPGGTGPTDSVSATTSIPIPTVDNVTISSPTINPNNTTQYQITVTGSNPSGGSDISYEQALINYQGSNAGNYRGYLRSYYDSNYTGMDGHKDKRVCSGAGGIAAIYPGGYGDGYLYLDSCSTSVAGNVKTTVFTVRFDPAFGVNGPFTNNDISGHVQNIFNNTDGWDNFDINFGILRTAPSTSSVAVRVNQYCTSGAGATIEWSYSDPSSSPQSAYQIQIDDQGSFNSPEYDSGKVISGDSRGGTGICNSSNPPGTGPGTCRMDFDNKTYQAQVKVWNISDTESVWTKSSLCYGDGCKGGGTWQTPRHAYPDVGINNPNYRFTWSPKNPAGDDPVQFTDRTLFDPSSSNKSWSWTFVPAGGGSGSSTDQNPLYTFNSDGIYQVTESVRDDVMPGGQYCVGPTQPVSVQKPIPIWKEVAPR